MLIDEIVCGKHYTSGWLPLLRVLACSGRCQCSLIMQVRDVAFVVVLVYLKLSWNWISRVGRNFFLIRVSLVYIVKDYCYFDLRSQ